MSARDSHDALAPAGLAHAMLPGPRENHLLAALPPDEYGRLLPCLEPVALPAGWTVHGCGDTESYLYFPVAGIVSRLLVTRSGESMAFALTGKEGVIGVASFLGGGSMPSKAVVLCPGLAYRLKGDSMKDASGHHFPTLMHWLLLYTQALIAQAGQTAVCNRHHSMEQQLCRWILSCLDRLPSRELDATHEQIAEMLGVRRESITQAAGGLQRAGVIRFRRGHVSVVDRAGLEARACECYAVVEREYRRLLGPAAPRGVLTAPSRFTRSTLESSS